MFIFNSKNFVRIFPYFFTETAFFFCCFFNYRVTSRCCLCKKHRNFRPDDSCFLSRNLFHCITKIFHMIQTDRCDHAGDRFYRTCCIQPTSKSCLKDNVFHFCSVISFHRHCK